MLSCFDASIWLSDLDISIGELYIYIYVCQLKFLPILSIFYAMSHPNIHFLLHFEPDHVWYMWMMITKYNDDHDDFWLLRTLMMWMVFHFMCGSLCLGGDGWRGSMVEEIRSICVSDFLVVRDLSHMDVIFGLERMTILSILVWCCCQSLILFCPSGYIPIPHHDVRWMNSHFDFVNLVSIGFLLLHFLVHNSTLLAY